MKQLLFLILFLPLCAFQVSAQIVNNGPGTFVWTNTAPKHNPGASGAKFAVNKNTFIWYEWLSDTTWTASGDRIQTISGCSAPNYTPGNHQSRVVINGCTSPNVPELYFYTGLAWVKLNSGTTYTAGAGINISGTTISADTVLLATQYDLSQVGVSWPLRAPDGLDTVPSYSFQNSPQTGLFLLPGRFSALDLGLQGGYRATLPGVGISAIAGGSDTGNGGRVSFLGGASVGGNGGSLDFQGGAVTGSDPTKKGGNVAFAAGSAPDGIGGDVTFQPGSGLAKGTIIMRSFYTPASTADALGERGSFSTDDNYLYTKTEAGWKRAQLTNLTELTGTGNRLALLNSNGGFVRGTIDPANVVALSGQTAGQIPKWNGSAWVPANDSIGGGGGSYTAGTGINITGTTISNTGVLGSGTVGRIPFFSLSQTIGSSGLTWDAVNNRLGINNASPARTLSVTGDASISGRLLTSTSGIGGANGNEVLRLLDGGTSRRVHLDNNTDGIIQSIVGGTAGNNQMYYFASSFRLFPDAGHTGALSFLFFPSAAQESGITLGHPTATSQTGRAALDFANIGSSGGRSDAGQITFRQDYANAPTTGLRIYNRFGVNQTSGTYNNVVFDNGVTVSSGNANTVNTTIGGTINQTGTSSGFYTSLSINPTISNLRGAYTGLEILPNTGTAIIQSGASATNRFAGSTIIGATTAPTQPLHVNGNARIDGAIMPGNSAGTSGQVLTSSGAGVAPVWVTTTLKATATLDFPSTGAHTNSDLTVTVTGAAVGDAVSVAPGLAAISDHSCYTAWVSATNTVTVRFNHYGTSGSTDPASASFNVIVHKF